MAGVTWSGADVRGTAAEIGPWWSLLTAHLPPEVVADLKTPDAVAVTTAAEAEAALASLSRAGREVAARGFGMAPQRGVAEGLFLGDGGVPKLPVDLVEVTESGVVGDRQRTRKHHGRVWQALCLWSADVVDVLRHEGHPVFAGACGENVSVRGIDWAALRPGTRLRLGTVLAEVSMPAIPCKQIRPFFAGAAIRRVDHARHPGSSRWYASVIEPGRIAAGDGIEVEPLA